MLTANETTLINNIASAVGKSAEFVIEQYASWHLANAIGWIFLGLLICWSATKITFDEHTDIPKEWQWAIKSCVVFFGMLFILSCVPDVANPRAAAIHQMLRDVNEGG